MIVVWADAALADLFDITDHFATRDPGFPRMMSESVDSALTAIRKHPRMFPETRRGVRKAPLPPTRYLLFYTVRPDRLEVIRIVHSARDWMNLL